MKKILILMIVPFFSLIHLHGDEFVSQLTEPHLEEPKEVNDKYGYFTYGFGLPGIFGLNLGMRNQHHHHGYEFGIGAVPLVVVYEFHTFASYLYYPKPALDSQFYLGLGLRAGYANLTEQKLKRGAGYIAPGMIFGKSYQADSGTRFFQVAFSPAAYAKNKVRFTPSINISYGYCF